MPARRVGHRVLISELGRTLDPRPAVALTLAVVEFSEVYDWQGCCVAVIVFRRGFS